MSQIEREGYQPGDSFDFVTQLPTYEGELSPGEQANADFADQLEGEALLDDLQDGGYVIYFRHAQTERDFADQVTADVNNFSTQRVLSEIGIQQSLVIGEGFERSQIPYDDVITSDYGRAVKTAAIAFGEYQKDSDLNFLPFEDYTDAQIEEMRVNVTPFLTMVPEVATNTIVVGHDDLFEAGTGIYPDPQGIAYLLKPDGSGSFDIIANLLPEEWIELSEGVSLPTGGGSDPVDTGDESFDGWTPGDSFDFVTSSPTYEGELNPGEQANADFVDQLEGAALLDKLQAGGHVIYFRHAQTERDFADQVTADVNNFSTQRVLSEIGVQQSLAIGEGFELSDIPFDHVITSDYGRAVETAAIAFGEYQKDSALNFLPFEDYTDEQIEQMQANVTPFLTMMPAEGTNTVIVGHDDLFESGTGIYPDPQGIAYVLEPDGDGGFDILANLLPEEWADLSESSGITTFNFDWTGQIAGFSVQGTFSYDSDQIYTEDIVREKDLTAFDISFFDPDGNLLRTYEDNHLTFGDFNFAFDIGTRELIQDGFLLGPNGFNFGEKTPSADGFSGLSFWSVPEFNSQGQTPVPHLHIDDWANEFDFPIGFSSHEDVSFFTRTTQDLLDTGRTGETYVDNTFAGLNELGERVEVFADGTVRIDQAGTVEDDTIVGSDRIDGIDGMGGDDTIAGGIGSDLILGGDGDDLLRGDLNNRSTQDTIAGGDDIIFGGEGSDRIGGKSGNDILSGDAGDDFIWGDDGDDIIMGTAGNDILVGDNFSNGSGSDLFVFGNGDGTDTILDFEVGIDRIGLVEGELMFAALTITQEDSSTLLGVASSGETLAILNGVQASALTQSSFEVVADISNPEEAVALI
ncbi:histidine phosphatase family protein [cf. Phormidesmis sp. LEGE 11477]|uniref:histidine phosphatase family protein n=1 Tax=cf. Phormidesmis sp. LEGE 11477 TaxID=1828680 RepID=UPI001D14F196|nr:histidine phosphatase family protein [cf. Phormidesmis sp. LEGE 11477]